MEYFPRNFCTPSSSFLYFHSYFSRVEHRQLTRYAFYFVRINRRQFLSEYITLRQKFEYFLEGGGDEKPDNTEDGDKEEREYLGGRTSLLLFGNRLRVSRFALRFLLLLLLSNSSSTLPSPSSTGLPREQLVEKQLSAERACRASAG